MSLEINNNQIYSKTSITAEELKKYILAIINDNQINRSTLTIQLQEENIDNFESLIAFSQEHQLHLTFTSLNNDAAYQQSLSLFNARLQQAYDQYGYQHVELQRIAQSNTINIILKHDVQFNFDRDNPALQELLSILNQNPTHTSYKIIYEQETQLDLSQAQTFIEYLSGNQSYLHIQFVTTNGTYSDKIEPLNQQLSDYHRYVSRKKQINPHQSFTDIVELQKTTAAPRKTRRTKQLLNQGIRIQAQLQHQVHHQEEHAVQQEQEIEQEQENQQQQFQQRQNQIAQQQERMRNVNQTTNTTNIGALGKLIHEGNLADLVSPQHSLADIQTVWFNLVGQYANQVEQLENKITHVPEATFWLIFANQAQFTQGIHFDNLPNGFGFTIDDSTNRSIFYYDQTLEKSTEARTDTFLAPVISPPQENITEFGTVGQFYPFFDTGININFDVFCEIYKDSFNRIFHPTQNDTLATRKAAMIELFKLDAAIPSSHESELLSCFDDFSHENLHQMGLMLLKYGTNKTVEFLLAIQKLKSSNQYTLFKAAFLDKQNNWDHLIAKKELRPGELTFLQGIDYLLQLPTDQKHWWEAMLTQHAAANTTCDFADLINAQKYFFDQIKTFDPPLKLPIPCPLKNIKNMKVAYDRLLYILRKAINPIEQAQYIENLDLGQQGVICDASRLGPYVLLTEEMQITPENSVFQWEKYSPYIPTFNITLLDHWYLSPEATRRGDGKKIYINSYNRTRTDVPQSYLCPPGFHTDIYRPGWATLNLLNFYPNDFVKLLEIGADGFLYTKILFRDFEGRFNTRSNYKIDDPTVQDEVYSTRLNQLGYDINLKKLLDFSNKLSLFHNVEKYFYRYIGTQLFTYDFKVYQDLIEILRNHTFYSTENQNIRLKKQLLPILALITTSRRTIELRNSQSIKTDFTQLLDHINQYLVAPDIIEKISNYFCKSELRDVPTLQEIDALIKLCFSDEITDNLIKCLSNHDKTIYQAIHYLSQHPHLPKRQHIDAFTEFSISLADMPEPAKKNVLLLLASLIKKEESSRFEELKPAIEKLNPLVLEHLSTLLQTIDVPVSYPLLSIEPLITLCEQLMTEENPSFHTVHQKIAEQFPHLRFVDPDIASSISTLITSIAPLADELDKIIPLAKAAFPTISDDRAQKILTSLLEKVILLNEQLKKINQAATTDNIKNVLAAIQSIVSFLENPFKDQPTNFSNIALGLIISQIKFRMLAIISDHILEAFSLEIAATINNLHINNQLLNEPEEKNIQLSTQFKNFLIATLPVIAGNNLTSEINAMFLQQEHINHLLERLKYWPSKSRSLLLAALFRLNYFHKQPPNPDLQTLTELIINIKDVTDKNLTRIVNLIIPACEDKNNVANIIKLLTTLREIKLNEEEFFNLISMGTSQDENQYNNAIYLIKIKKIFEHNDNHARKIAFVHLLQQSAKAQNKEAITELLTSLHEIFSINNVDTVDKLITFINFCFNTSSKPLDDINKLITALKESEQIEGLLTILQGACWESEEEYTIGDQIQAIALLSDSKLLSDLILLYRHRPCPDLKSLQEICQKSEEEQIAWIINYELDPFGHRTKIQSQYNMTGIESYVNEINPLLADMTISIMQKNQLIEGFAYLIGISNKLCLPVNGNLKPVNQFSKQELNAYYQQCVSKAANEPDNMTVKLETLAIFCEVIFRTTGKYPYHSQILSVLTTIYFEGNTILQIPTGQGKSITNTLLAAMHFSFSGVTKKPHVSVTSRNSLLTHRDYRASLNFYHYLDIPVAYVRANTAENYFETPTIIYTTVADDSLYRSKLKMVDAITFPEKENQIIIADEIDADLYDNKNAFNFSNSQEDPFINPLEWIYPLVNQYVDSPFFNNETLSEQDDIDLLRRFIEIEKPELYARFKKRLTDFKLNQLIDAACISKQLVEDQDFIIRKVTREVHGKVEIISEAHVLVNHIEDKEATLSYGVQQALHDRLNKKYQQQINRYNQGQTEDAMPAFSCDNQIDCVDSQNSNSYFKQFGKIIGTTGTAGTEDELREVTKLFNIRNLLNMPPRRKSKLDYLPTLFTDEAASFFFRSETQIAAIKATVAKHRNQPVMISCENIAKAEEFYQALYDIYGDNVQIIHAKNADDSANFERLIDEAKNPGKITIVTPLAGRGVDIKPRSTHAQASNQKLRELAECLLVIETHVERYRNRKQLQGRTARDGKPGQTIGIFNVTELSQHHSANNRRLSTQEKIDILESIVKKMDKEAAFERKINTQVKDVVLFYENLFDKQLKQADYAKKESLIIAKTEFIVQADSIWHELLSESDPGGKRVNPYIDYTEDGHLNEDHLKSSIQAYEERLKELFLTLTVQSEINSVEDSATIPQNGQPSNNSDDMTPPIATGEPLIITTFIKNNENNSEDPLLEEYTIALKQEMNFFNNLNFWIEENSKSEPALKKILKHTQDIRLRKIGNFPSYPIAIADSLTNILTSDQTMTPAILSKLFNFAAIAYQDLKSKPTITQNEKCLTAIKTLFTQAFMRSFNKLSSHDRSVLTSLSTQINQLNNITSLLDLEINLINLINSAEYQIKSRELGHYLESTKNFITTLARCSTLKEDDHIDNMIDIAQPQQKDIREADVRLMINQIKNLLVETKKRLNGRLYQNNHTHSQTKINLIDSFINHITSDDFLTSLLKDNRDSIKDIFKRINEIKISDSNDSTSRNLMDILSFNTRTGESTYLTETTSGKEYLDLFAQFDCVFHLRKNTNNKEDYKIKLESILNDLKSRKTNAGFWKDAELYSKKVEKLEGYIKKITELLDAGDKSKIDFNTEIQSLLLRIQYDPDIYTSTARFFKRESTVTVVKEIIELSEEMMIQRFR